VGDDGPLTPDQHEELARATQRARKVLGAGRVATFNGWALGISAGVTLLFAPFSLTALVMGVGLGWVARDEFRGRTRLRLFDVKAPRFLGRNQLRLMALLVGYSLWSIYLTVTSPVGSELAELEAVVGDLGDLITDLTLAVYAAVIVLSVLFQGLNALYYFARTERVREYLDETPEWIVKLQRSSAVT
jgi:hypothetical protein